MSTQADGLGGYLTYLEEHCPGAVWRVGEPVSVRHEITALQVWLEQVGRRPVVIIERPTLSDGRESTIPVVTNLEASRTLAARVLGVRDHRQAASHLAGRMSGPIEPVIVPRDEAPAAVVQRDDAKFDLTQLPALVQHSLDPGPYLSAAHVSTVDPDTSIDNTAIQRAWVRGPGELRLYPYSRSHNAINIRKWWALGEDAPVALWIGHHPAVDVGTNQKLSYPESHWGRAGALLGAPVRLMPTLLFGGDLLVPADAEIVIEGYVLRDTLRAEGPFGEYTGYLGPQRPSPVVDVKAVSMRERPIYHDYGSGLPDMLVPDNLMLEGAIYEALATTIPSVRAVHVPSSGRRFHCYVQLEQPAGGEAREAIRVTLENRRIKHVVVVDEDIDIFDEAAVMWAIATRVQWARDTVGVTGRDCSPGDPSLPIGCSVSDKAGIDATLPESIHRQRPRPSAGIAEVGRDVDMAALVRRLRAPDLSGMIAE